MQSRINYHSTLGDKWIYAKQACHAKSFGVRHHSETNEPNSHKLALAVKQNKSRHTKFKRIGKGNWCLASRIKAKNLKETSTLLAYHTLNKTHRLYNVPFSHPCSYHTLSR